MAKTRRSKSKSASNSEVRKRDTGPVISYESEDEADFDPTSARGIREDEIEFDDAEERFHAAREDLDVFETLEEEEFEVPGNVGKKGKKQRDVLTDLGLSDSDDDDDAEQLDVEEDEEEEAMLRKFGVPQPGDSDSDSDSGEEQGPQTLGWGRKSAFYGGDEADVAEDEEARELEEEEVRRMEKRRAEWLGDEDLDDVFGTTEKPEVVKDDISDDGWDMDGTKGLDVKDLAPELDPALKELVEKRSATRTELLSALPELEVLSEPVKNWVSALPNLEKAATGWLEARKYMQPNDPLAQSMKRQGELLSAKYRKLLAYILSRSFG
jgi:hypothetical protein